MYKCPKCGHETAELPTIRQLLGEYYKETLNFTCQSCGKEDYDTAERCKICGRWTCYDELDNNHDVCKKCAESVQTYYKAFRAKLNDDEWNYLVDYMEERNFE